MEIHNLFLFLLTQAGSMTTCYKSLFTFEQSFVYVLMLIDNFRGNWEL